jgi:hypothetical protein
MRQSIPKVKQTKIDQEFEKDKQNYLKEKEEEKKRQKKQFGSRVEINIEKLLVRKRNFKQLQAFFLIVEKVIWVITGLLLLLTIISSFSPFPILTALIIFIICITIIFIGTLAYKYTIDLASVEPALKTDPKTKIKVQERRIQQLIYLVAINFYIALTFFLTVTIQPFVYSELMTNQMLSSTHSGFMPSVLSNALWFNYNHFPYAIMILLPGLLLSSLIVYTQTFELFIKLRPMFDQWGGSRYFKSNTFNSVLNPKGPDYFPTLRIGFDVETQSDLFLLPKARVANIHIVGVIGTGKSAAIMRPMLREDASKVFLYWRDYAAARRKFPDFKSFEKYWFVEERNGQYINGFKVMDPSNSLTAGIYKELLSMGVPREAITYLNPPDPLSDSIQAFSGDFEISVTTIKGAFMELVTRGSMNPNPFFTGEAELYLTNALQLVKFSSQIPNKIDKEIGNPSYEAVFEIIADGSENIRYERLLALEKYLELLKARIKKESIKVRKTPKELGDFETLENRLKIAKTTYDNWKKWLILTEKDGKIIIEDIKDKNVTGLRTAITNLSQSTYIRRILTRKSNFDFDVLMKFGGFLLVNTSSETLGQDAPIIGKLISQNFQNAVMRRMNNIDRDGEISDDATHNAYFTSADDEKPPYLTTDEPNFLSNSRKYKIFNAFAHQANAQLELYLSKPAKVTLLEGTRNEFVYQGIGEEDGKHYSTEFGSKLTVNTDYTKQVYDIQGNDDGGRTSARETLVEKPNASLADIVELPQFYMIGRYTDGDEVTSYVKIRAYPFFDKTDDYGQKLLKSNFNREDFDLWYADVQEALEQAKSKNDVDASTKESIEIIRKVEEKQKAESLLLSIGKDDFQKGIGRELRPQARIKSPEINKQRGRTLKQALNYERAIPDKIENEIDIDQDQN